MALISQSFFVLTLCCLALVFPALAAAGACGQPATAITDVQGRSDTSPLVGQTVTVEGVITQDVRQSGGFSGFYLQSSDTPQDTERSSALFVYTRHSGGRPGQRLRLTGRVKEHYGLTEIVRVKSLRVCGTHSLPPPVAISLPWSQPPESLENMRVRVSGPLHIIDSYQLARFGEVSLAAVDPVMATEFLAPGPTAQRRAQLTALNTLILDDGHARRQPSAVKWFPDYTAKMPGQAANALVAGTQLNGLAGVLDYRYGAWRLQPNHAPQWQTTPPPEPAPARPAGTNLRIMTLNLNNLFNGDGRGEGFPNARGARTEAQFKRQLRRLITALRQPDADLLALQELENDGYGSNSAIAQLAAALGPQWRFVAPVNKSAQKDAIRNALLYREDRLRPLGSAEYLAGSGRPAITQQFALKNGGASVRLVSLHLKSKSCRNASGANLRQNDGQGCYNALRVQQARSLRRQLKTLDDHNSLAGTLVTGDFNSYSQEQPIKNLIRAGYTSMVAHFHPCTPTRCEHYSYRFKGARGSLDHALATANLAPKVLSARTWNINADQARITDYRSHSSSKPWRSSDHNPLITDLKL